MKKVLILLVLVTAVAGFKCGDDTQLPEPVNTIQYTASGARVESSQEVDAETLTTIDAALTRVFADARALGYANVLTHAEYAIYVNRACVPRENGVMAWLVRADNYDGTEWDQDPRPGVGMVYAAELVVKKDGEVVPRYIICLDTQAVMSESARNGPEHIIYWFNDRAKFIETETHTSGGHPIIPFAE